MSRYDLSIVIPFLNEEKNVENVVKSVIGNLRGLHINYEIILVNNGSSDSTGDIIDAVIKKNKNLKKVSLDRNEGYGWGIINGLKIARGDCIGYIDGDGQFGCENIVKAYKKMKDEKLDFCKGIRIGRRDSFKRNAISVFYNFLVNMMFFVNLRDINSKPKLMSKACYDGLNIRSKDWFIDTEIMLKVKKKGYRYGEIYLEYKKRSSGKSNISLGDIKQFLRNLLLFRFGGALCRD